MAPLTFSTFGTEKLCQVIFARAFCSIHVLWLSRSKLEKKNGRKIRELFTPMSTPRVELKAAILALNLTVSEHYLSLSLSVCRFRILKSGPTA